MAERSTYEVLVGNIGSVYVGPNARKARADFRWYRKQSKFGVGRAAGESVTLLIDDGIILDEYHPPAAGDDGRGT